MHSHYLRSLPCIIVIIALIAARESRGETWPQFRGHTGNGLSSESDLPTVWSPRAGVLWATDLSGRANSSPAVTSQRVDLTTQEADRSLWVISLDRLTGKVIHKTPVGKGALAAKGDPQLYAHRHNAATPSPIADEEHVWAFFGTGLLVCLDADQGRVIWERDLTEDYGAYDITFGMGSSPRLWGDLLYIACMTKGPSYVLALDKMTGQEVWKQDREFPAQDDGPDAYSTPIMAELHGEPALLISGSDHVNAYDPLTGRQLWASDGLAIQSPFGRVIASPVAVREGIVVATSGNPGGGGLGHMLAVAVPDSSPANANHLWRFAQASPDSSTPVCAGDLLFLLSDHGVLTCLDVTSGEIHWRRRLETGPYHASLVAGDGKVYALSIRGTCTVFSADKTGRPLARNQLPGTFYATPAISDGVIFLRAYERLYAVGTVEK